MIRLRRAALLALIATACQAPPPPLAPPAEVSIELLPGLARREPIPQPEAERVEVLLDVTPSPGAGPEGIEPWAAARSAAARFVNGLPDATPLRVHALGLTPGRSCEPASLLDPRQRAESHAALATQIEALAPAGEGSLAVALAELRGVVAEGGDLEGIRVVVFSDLGPECGGDLCTAVALLLDAGARLDFVVIGEAPAPACFGALVPADRWQHAPLIEPPDYRIVAYDPSGERAPFVLGEGRADATRRRLPAGPVTIQLALDPPAQIGPLVLSPGALTRVLVIEFPGLDPAVREWTAVTEPLASGNRGAP
jgi:hypothetical protein